MIKFSTVDNNFVKSSKTETKSTKTPFCSCYVTIKKVSVIKILSKKLQMEIGQTGQLGLIVARPVETEVKLITELALTPLPTTMVRIALERIQKL
jgi:hypothetical protein